jgi:hypothetical protein
MLQNKKFENEFFYFLPKKKRGKMMTRQDQEMASSPITSHRESLTIPSRQIKEHSPTCIKTLFTKNKRNILSKES